VHVVTSFHGASVQVGDLSAVMTDYLALERARIYRRLFVIRFALLATALGVIGFGFHWLPPTGSWVSVGLCAIAPTWAWIAELRCDWRLSRRLNALPEGSTELVVPPQAEKVVKRS
jgi:hypothetical protein